MVKQHSTVSRRDFMKALGIGAAGVAAVGTASSVAIPAFKDLDDMASFEHTLKPNRKWWVKEREILDPTVEVDWNTLAPAKTMETMWVIPSWKKYVSPAEVSALQTETTRTRNQWYAVNSSDKGENGCRMRDWQLQNAGGFQNWSQNLNGYQGSGWGGGRSLTGPATPNAWNNAAYIANGSAKWQGTPEENTLMLRAAMRYFGSPQFGVIKLTSQTKKLLNDIEPGLTSMNSASFGGTWADVTPTAIRNNKARRIRFKDMDLSNYPPQPAAQDGVTTTNGPYAEDNPDDPEGYGNIWLPNGDAWILSYTIPMDKELFRTGQGILRIVGNVSRYSQQAFIQSKLQMFLKGLGYWCAGYPNRAFGLMPAQGSAILAGECEQGRSNNVVISPDYGSVCGYFSAITNFPLVETKPIDAGIHRFCHTCRKCANECPGEAISQEKETSWDIPKSKWTSGTDPSIPAYSRIGKKTFWTDAPACKMVTESALSCGNCMGTCTFNTEDYAIIHEMVRSTVSVTSLFNSFFWRADDWYGFKSTPIEERDRWYSQYRPAYCYDTTI